MSSYIKIRASSEEGAVRKSRYRNLVESSLFYHTSGDITVDLRDGRTLWIELLGRDSKGVGTYELYIR